MLGRQLGSGQMAEVFEWGSAVIKLYRPGWGKEPAVREAETLALLENGSLPVPKVFGIEHVEERWGVVMSRAPGRPIATEMLDNPADAMAMLEAVVGLQLRIHAQPGGLLPHLYERLREAIYEATQLSADDRRAMMQLLDALPEGHQLCHGDFHPYNVMGSVDTPVIVDWLDASRGAPEADACRSYLLLLHNFPDMASAYLDAYLRLGGGSREAVLAWLPVLAAARLAENVPDEFERLLALVRGAIR